MPDKLITPLTGNSKPVYTSPEDYYNTNIFVNTTGEVDKTFTPRLYKID